MTSAHRLRIFLLLNRIEDVEVPLFPRFPTSERTLLYFRAFRF
jgi:hypothetical protein